MHDLKPFRILISLLDKPELGNEAVTGSIFSADVCLRGALHYKSDTPIRLLSCLYVSPGPAILEDVLIEVFRTLHTQCRTELDLQNQSPFSKDHTHLSRSVQSTQDILHYHCVNNTFFKNKQGRVAAFDHLFPHE